MNYKEVIEAARPRLGKYCKGCYVCNGKACGNTMPGPGAKGVGDTAIRNYAKWQEIRVNMDCLVQRGAALVYAVDVGFGQLMGKLRQDAHVVNLERTNIGDEGLLALSPRPDFGTVDVSYLSLRKAIPYFSAILHGQGELCCLIKPLFEIDDAQARRTGVIAEESYAPLLLDLIRDVNAMPGAAAAQITHSHVTGNAGTREFFLHVALGRACPPIPQEAVYAAVARAQELERYKKS